MTKTIGLMIAGEAPSVGELSVVSPYTLVEITKVEQCAESHIEAALTLAHATYRDRKQWMSVPQRVALFEKVAEIMQNQVEELALIAASEGGKPLIDSLVEVNRAIAGVKMCAEHITSHMGEVVPMSEADPQKLRMAFTQREPIGVVVAVSAFNHPLNLIVHQVGAAIAAGCPVIIKPADDTPLSCLRFVEILREAGLEEKWCQVAVPENLELATKLVSDSRVAFFSFIGSAKVGWMLRSKLAPGTRCALEHGGVAPVFVDESADLNKAIPAILKGGFYHAGQVCVSVQRVFTHSSLVKELCDALVAGAKEQVVGDPLDDKTEVGPIIRPAEIERIDQWVQAAIELGAEKLCGAEVLPNNCYSPTVLFNPPADCDVSTKEIFGPVICVYSYDDVDEALQQANSLDVSFQAAVFAQDIDAAMYIYNHVDGSAIMLNDHTAFRQDNMPFAGLRHSGLGVGGIGHTINDMQIEKMLVIKS